MACCLRRVAFLSSFTGRIQLYLAGFLKWATPPYHHTQRLCYTAPSVLLAAVHFCLVAYWRGWLWFAEDTGLIVGRTLVDPSKWKVPVLVSNFGQETVVVNPFTEVGMITQVTAIQSVADDGIQPQGATGELPYHLQDLIDQTSGDLDASQRHRLAEVLLKYADIFPVPGDPLTGHTDAVEHDINTGDRPPIRCAPRRMSP